MQSWGVTKEAIRMADDMKYWGFNWEYTVADLFTPDGEKIFLCLEINRNEDKAQILDQQGQSYDPDKVTWLPKWSGCEAWLNSRGWRVKMRNTERGIQLKLVSKNEFEIDATGKSELEAIYAGIIQVLELDTTKRTVW